MANFKTGYILTDAGKALQAKVEAGETLKLTKMSLGNGTVSSIDEYADKTDLINRKYDMLISKIEAKSVGCMAVAAVNSQAVETGFDVTELGLFAQDGETEILYCVSYDADAMYVPGKSDGNAVECEFSIYIQFATAENVQLVLPTDVSEITKWVEANALKCDEAAGRAETSIAAADRAEQEAANATTAAATAESAKEDAQTASTAAATSEENAKASETAAAASEANAAASATLAGERADSIKGDVEKAAVSASAAKVSEENAAASETAAAASAKKAEEEAQKVVKVLKYKGSVDNYSDLPTAPETGDMWNIKNADKTHSIKAGDNVVWTGAEWDDMGGVCDMSNVVMSDAADKGGDAVGVYIKDRKVCEMTATVGATDNPVYLNAGTITACDMSGYVTKAEAEAMIAEALKNALLITSE